MKQVPLRTICDLLQPGVVAHIHRRFGGNPGIDGVLVLDGDNIDLIVKRGSITYRKTLLCEADLAHESYKDKFGPRMIWLMDGAAEAFGIALQQPLKG